MTYIHTSYIHTQYFIRELFNLVLIHTQYFIRELFNLVLIFMGLILLPGTGINMVHVRCSVDWCYYCITPSMNFSTFSTPPKKPYIGDFFYLARHVVATHLEHLQLVPNLLKIFGTPSSVFMQLG